MNRTLVILTAAALLMGCSKEYERKNVGPDEQQQVRQMILDVRQAGEAKLPDLVKSRAAEGLDADQRSFLSLSLAELANAKSADLAAVDQFGEKVLRASIRIEDSNGPRTVCFLLVRQGGKLLWAGRN
jgi:hypothetical protein